MNSAGRRNVRLWLVFNVSQYMPLYWPYMFHLVTVTRGLSAADFGLLKGVYYLVAIAAEIPAGIAADRFSRRTAMLLGAFGNGCACLLYAKARTLEGFALAEMLFGASMALVNGADSAFLYDSLREDGQAEDYLRISSRGRMAAFLGTAAALPFCDAFLVRDGDPTLTYTATALLSWAGVVTAAFLLEPRRSPTLTASKLTLGALAEVRGSPKLIALLAFTTGCFLLVRSSNTLFYNPLLSARGIPASAYGGIFAAISVAGALAAWRIHRVEAALGSRLILAAVPPGLILMYAALLGFQSEASASLFLFAGVVAGILTPVSQHLLNKLASSSEHRATLLSVQSVCWRGGYAAASIVLGQAMDLYSVSFAVLLLIGLALLLVLPSASTLLRGGTGLVSSE